MSKKLDIIFRLEKGILKPLSAEKGKEYKEFVNELEGGLIKATFQVYDKKASHNQFEYLYGYIYPTIQKYFEEVGIPKNDNTLESIDYTFKMLFLFEEVFNPIECVYHKIPLEKKKIGVKKMKEYISNIVDYCAINMNLVLMSSEDYYKQFEETY